MVRQFPVFWVAVMLTFTSSAIPIAARPKDVPLSGNKQQQVPAHQNDPNKADAQSKATPLPVSPAPPTKSGQDAASQPYDDKPIEREALELNRRYVRYTGYLVVIGAIIGGLQLLLLLFQSIYTGKAAKEAARAATTAERTLLLTERADLLVADVTIGDPENFQGESKVTVIVQNFGRTRADNVRMAITLNVDGVSDAVGHSKFPDGMPIGPGHTQALKFPELGENFTHEAYDEVMAGTVGFSFDGIIEYDDVFKNPHATRIQGTWNPRTGRFGVVHYRGD